MCQDLSASRAARELILLKEDAEAILYRNGRAAGRGALTGADLQEWFDACDQVATAAEAFRRRFYPRRGRVSVALSMVATSGKTGRRGEIIYALCRRPLTLHDGEWCCDGGHVGDGPGRCDVVTVDKTDRTQGE